MSHSTEKQMLTDKEVAEMLGLGKSTVWKFVKDGHLPAPIRLGRATRWRKSDIVAIMSQDDPDAGLRAEADAAHILAENGFAA